MPNETMYSERTRRLLAPLLPEQSVMDSPGWNGMLALALQAGETAEEYWAGKKAADDYMDALTRHNRTAGRSAFRAAEAADMESAMEAASARVRLILAQGDCRERLTAALRNAEEAGKPLRISREFAREIIDALGPE